jgi:hypothetical protein
MSRTEKWFEDDNGGRGMSFSARTGGPHVGSDSKAAVRFRGLKSQAMKIAIPIWLSCIFIGFKAQSNYSYTPGTSAGVASTWPGGVPRLAEGRSTLVIFAHPECPCTTATLHELSEIMARYAGSLDARVVFYVPSIRPANWSEMHPSSKMAIPGVRASEDPDGVLARKFGARTSGQTYFYDAQGRLKFSGGITRSRGETGENRGREAITAILAGKTPLVARTPVFGCSLLSRAVEK